MCSRSGVAASSRPAELGSGVLRVGDEAQIDGGACAQADAIEMFRKKLDGATVGDNVGLPFASLAKSQLARGMVLTSAGSCPPTDGLTVRM
jgi:translation elongation factor EF-Tu-like GTPase